MLELLDQLNPWIAELDRAVIQEVQSRPEAMHLMREPGVGPVTALAFVLTIGLVGRFQRSKEVVSYLGLNPSEESSGGRQRLGSISKQGNAMVRYSGVAKVAIARKLAVAVLEAARSSSVEHRRSHAGQPGKSCGGRKSIAKMIERPASP